MGNLGWLFLAVLIAYGCAAVAPLLRDRLRGRAGDGAIVQPEIVRPYLVRHTR
jgi:hypothetical protein